MVEAKVSRINELEAQLVELKEEKKSKIHDTQKSQER